MRRFLALLLLVFVLLPATCMRMERPRKTQTLALHFVPVALDAAQREAAAELGPFQLEHVWRIESRYLQFGGYSALVSLGGGRLLAISDSGYTLRFSVPDAPQEAPVAARLLGLGKGPKITRDFESATADPAREVFWAGMEFENAIMRFRPDDKGRLFSDGAVRPRGMADWGNNTGPESLVRFHDGTFLTLREGFTSLLERRRHSAIRFRSDPVEAPDGEPFIMAGPAGLSPTDAAQLPDGRVLILFRRVQWPMPPKFAGAIAIGDPADIRHGGVWRVRQLAKWGFGLPRDNFEGLAVDERGDGRLTIWLISDDNRSTLQQTMLWELTLDPRDLPRTRQKARENSRAP